ncbi:MAG: T9SS C-terminal target domain-containing protein, partial [Crocinitomicaceae bacterium]|nr:T9SS C-terminal target domain-containing protein [Crocinitomicaceae bacterium]
FPNPATTTFTISGIPASTLGEKATLKDLSGKIVMEFELNEQNQLVDVSQLRKGIYLLQIGESTQKISIE